MVTRLTDKQEQYVQGLIKGLSQRAAYRLAYPNDKCSDNGVDVHACELFKNSKILVRYNELKDKITNEIVDKASVTVRQILDELALIGLMPIGTNENVKTSDKNKSLELIGKHLGMFTEKIEHSGFINSNLNEEQQRDLIQEMLKEQKLLEL